MTRLIIANCIRTVNLIVNYVFTNRVVRLTSYWSHHPTLKSSFWAPTPDSFYCKQKICNQKSLKDHFEILVLGRQSMCMCNKTEKKVYNVLATRKHVNILCIYMDVLPAK